MVEVFKTNVHDPFHAAMLLEKIHTSFTDYQANFDLDDCDRILRIESSGRSIPPGTVIGLLNTHGFEAEVLE